MKISKVKPDVTSVWIGLVKTSQSDRNGPLGEADQAYVNVVGLAEDKHSFRSLAKAALADLDLKLLRLENAEILEERMAHGWVVHKRILRLAENLTETVPVAFDVFATFDKDDQ